MTSTTVTVGGSLVQTGDLTTDNVTAGGHRKGHRRQESMYAMTGLYSDAATTEDSSSVEMPLDDVDGGGGGGGCSSWANVAGPVGSNNPAIGSAGGGGSAATASDTIIKCHSREPSQQLNVIDQRSATLQRRLQEATGDPDLVQDCGMLTCYPKSIQKMARIKVFVFLLSVLVTLQQALSSGYINSVITTIEKRFEIPSSYSGLIASSYEIGNVITVIFVSYLGSRRHIPVWIGVGAVIMGIGSLVFMVPHFTGEPNPGVTLQNMTTDNICRGISFGTNTHDMGLDRLSGGVSNPALAPSNNIRGDNCIKGGKSSTFGPVVLFVIAQLLLGCGGSPLFTLGTTFVDDHVRAENSSMYIGCMYCMGAFGPVLGFLCGAYLLSFHMDFFTSTLISIGPGDRRWVGMWWGGFLVGGVLLIIVAIPFFLFPKVLTHEKKKLHGMDACIVVNPPAATITNTTVSTTTAATVAPPSSAVAAKSSSLQRTATNNSGQAPPPEQQSKKFDSGYGKDIKDIPLSMWRLVTNPVYLITCLGACMELMIVSGFVVFLPKYLETQFSLGKSQASVFTGAIAIPGACIGILVGGYLLKRLQLKPKGAVQFVLISNVLCLACYALLFFLGCNNLKMAGTTTPYYNQSHHQSLEPFQVNLTAACNFGCECHMYDVEPVCGNNGLTYFSPCHAGCTEFSSSRSNYTNCACVQNNVTNVFMGSGGSQAQASIAAPDFAEVTVVPVATAGPCNAPCRTIYPFLILLFFMTFLVASTQMPLLMIVLRSVSAEERSFALGMQFVIFRLFGYIPAPIVFGNLIDSSCLLWKSTCGENGGRCLLYDIEKFRYKYVGLCASIKIVALAIFMVDWWFVNRRKNLEKAKTITAEEIVGSIISLDKLFEDKNGVGTESDGMECTNLKVYNNNADGHKQRILVATNVGGVGGRHSRNGSRTIQLEIKYDNAAASGSSGGDRKSGGGSFKKSHIRSSSCDVRIVRSNSRDYETSDSKLLKLPKKCHSRTNSRDVDQEFLKKFGHHTRPNADHLNIKYIINYLKSATPRNGMMLDEEQLDNCSESGGGGARGHSRNHSYDRIYLANNTLDNGELRQRLSSLAATKDVNLAVKKCNVEPATVVLAEGAGLPGIPASLRPENYELKYTHSRNNSKDFNVKTPGIVGVGEGGNSELRHRRTNSKDLNLVTAAAATNSTAAGCSSNLNSSSGSSSYIQRRHSGKMPVIEPPITADLLLAVVDLMEEEPSARSDPSSNDPNSVNNISGRKMMSNNKDNDDDIV